ncbi:hypothetical protein O59_002533 [Cellvibrio sp. BR]|nr:hypothetical protein O59_002533 [Cellvibrio sp. BR]
MRDKFFGLDAWGAHKWNANIYVVLSEYSKMSLLILLEEHKNVK